MNHLMPYGLTGRFENEASLYPEWALARVTAQYKGLYKIVTAEGERLAELSGKLRYEADALEKLPAVGDFVMAAWEEGDSNAILHRVLTRKSAFLRKAVGTSGQAQVVAANIDTVFLCMSLNNNFNLSRLERYLAIAWDSGATPVILLTKADLCQDVEAAVAQVSGVSAFCDVLTLSMYETTLADKLRPYLKEGVTAAFIGSSGVGKSTLINALLRGTTLPTGEIGRGDKGRHTTTGRELFLCPLGGVVIDTPGMRELGVESVDLEASFSEIEALALRCKFRDCGHTTEPGCAVREALESGAIDRRRLDNYFKLKNEAGYEGLTSREIEAKKLERLFKDVGGMKGAKKFIKETLKPKP